jgi:DNA-binding HxlR family transcriptional regulator
MDRSIVSRIPSHPFERTLRVPPAPPPKRHPYNQWAPDARALDLVGDKWTLLIVRDLVAGPRRFVELQRVLPGISTEQLRSRLNRRVDYELTERSRDLLPVIGALARWGHQWTWSAPRQGEQVDIGAILRSVPGLAAPADLSGSVALTVARRDGSERHYVLHARDGDLVLEEGAEADPDADATVSGTEDAWIDALGPEGDRSALEVSGASRAADALLAFLAPLAAREAAVA